MSKPKIAIYYGDKRNNGDYDNGVWMDLLGIPFVQDYEKAGEYDIIIRTLWLDAIGMSKMIRSKFPHVKQIGLSDHPLSTHISKMSADRQVAYLQDLESLDAVMALTEEEREWYQTALPSKPVIKVGLPFPFKSYEERFGVMRQEEKRFIGLGVGASDNDRNFISDVIVFQRLLLDHPDIQGVFLSIPPQLMSYCYYLCEKFPNMYIQERTDMATYYQTLATCKFVISLADRNTPGRLQGEAAFFNIPVIGSNRLELQNELYPDLSVTPYQLEKATQMGNYLLNNPAILSELGKRAAKKLARYDYRASRRKFNALLNRI